MTAANQPAIADRATQDRWTLVLLALAAVLLCANLNSGYLWQDEAETAILARRTLQFGYPKALDGINPVDSGGFGYGPGGAWIYSPWLQFYVLAGTFAVLGESTWSARLPFALFGWVTIWLAWRLARRLTGDRTIERLTVAILMLSVPFLIQMRQCRYYSITTALFVGICLSYLAFSDRSSLRSSLGLALLMILLFHANFAVWIPAMVAIGLHQLGWGSRRSRRWAVGGLMFVTLFTVPWAMAFYCPNLAGTWSLSRCWHHLEFYLRVINKYLVPLAAIGGFSLPCLIVLRRALRVTFWHRLAQPVRWWLVLLIGLQLAFLFVVPDQRHFRYVMPLFPVLAIVEAGWFLGCLKLHRLFGGLVIGLALFTTLLHTGRLQVPLADFGYELTHQYRGPMEGVVGYLARHAKPGDRVKTPYDDRTLMFYTSLSVEPPSRYLEPTDADWIIIRRGWTPESFLTSEVFQRIQRTYERIEVDAPDIYWQNREDLAEHHFRTVEDAPRVVLYHRPVGHG